MWSKWIKKIVCYNSNSFYLINPTHPYIYFNRRLDKNKLSGKLPPDFNELNLRKLYLLLSLFKVHFKNKFSYI